MLLYLIPLFVLGFLLIFFSSFGQTYFISLSAGHIREEYGLTNGGFGTLYMLGRARSAPELSMATARARDGSQVRKLVSYVDVRP